MFRPLFPSPLLYPVCPLSPPLPPLSPLPSSTPSVPSPLLYPLCPLSPPLPPLSPLPSSTPSVPSPLLYPLQEHLQDTLCSLTTEEAIQVVAHVLPLPPSLVTPSLRHSLTHSLSCSPSLPPSLPLLSGCCRYARNSFVRWLNHQVR